MIDIQAYPAAWREQGIQVRWNADGTDLHPSTEKLIDEIKTHDQRFRAAITKQRHMHLLYDRWVRLSGPLEPISETPFQEVMRVCSDLGWGLSAALMIGSRKNDADAPLKVAQWLTEVELVLSPSPTQSDSALLDIINRIARSHIAVTLSGDMRQFRRMGVTALPSLQARPHTYRERMAVS